MRPTAWVSLLALSLLTIGVVRGLPTAHAGPAAPQTALPSWVVPGQWMTSEEEAVDDALERARDKVTEYLRGQNPPKEWPIDPAYLRQKMWRDLKPDEEAVKALRWEKTEKKTINNHLVQIESKSFEGLGDMYRAAIYVSVLPDNQAEFKRQEELYQTKQRESRATHRQGVLVRVMAGLVAVLVAIAFYLRLEDATKGYYTTLLRLAAVTFIGLVGAGIWLLT
jgi:hypothetical protein